MTSKERKELIKIVHRLLLRDTPYTNDSAMADRSLMAMCKMSNADLDIIGTILMSKPQEESK